MNERRFILAVEGLLDEAVAVKILKHFKIEVSQTLGREGQGFLKKKAQKLNQVAKQCPVLILTDQDSPAQCPPELIRSWVKGEQSSNLLLRVAVMEVESWVMADRSRFADFLSIPLHRVPQETDAIPQPKKCLVSLARLSRKKNLQEDLVPAPGATSKVGPNYNSRLGEFVRDLWSVNAAAAASPSLARTLARLDRFSTS